jgi:hypothetical protein
VSGQAQTAVENVKVTVALSLYKEQLCTAGLCLTAALAAFHTYARALRPSLSLNRESFLLSSQKALNSKFFSFLTRQYGYLKVVVLLSFAQNVAKCASVKSFPSCLLSATVDHVQTRFRIPRSDARPILYSYLPSAESFDLSFCVSSLQTSSNGSVTRLFCSCFFEVAEAVAQILNVFLGVGQAL